jgi:hypothetical protein
LFREKPWQGDSQWVAVSFSVRQCQVPSSANVWRP